MRRSAVLFSPFVGPVRSTSATMMLRTSSTEHFLERKAVKKKWIRTGGMRVLEKDKVAERRESPLEMHDEETGWNQKKKRCGAIAIKIGMLGEYSEYMEWLPITVLQILDCEVVQIKPDNQKEGLVGLQLGAVSIPESRLARMPKALRGHFFNADIMPKKVLMEFKVSPDAVLPVGTQLRAEHFVPGQYLDLTGKSKGKGFSGVMKRWGYSGGPASHGSSLFHRSGGSIGQHSIPSKVWKGKKMAGRMGNSNTTVKNAFLWKIDTKNNLLYVKGQVPGAPGTFIRVRDAKNKLFEHIPPYPTYDLNEDEVLPELITANSPEPMWFKKMMGRQESFAEDLSKNTDDQQSAVQAVLDHRDAYPSYDKWKRGLLPPGPNPSTHVSCASAGSEVELPWFKEFMKDLESGVDEDIKIEYQE